ncbi:histidine kinase [Hymenobacter gummosus]|uniref:histidine kinase n=1 Tax=Hymenobacter gummosus TaxID=1776032 RepID=A0A3S0K7B4_9BACT|nr:ATP-binding protein [Hymenobacter gummosus]RTQ52087.1 histidine kinase [Hymenobacter gummosus]
MDFNTSLILPILIALWVVRMLRQFLSLPLRAPRLSRQLDWIWVPGAALLALSFFLKSDLFDEAYLVFVLSVIGLVLLRTQDYRPARTLLLGLAPYALYSLIELLVALVGKTLLKSYDEVFDTSQGFAVIWLFTFGLIARNQKKHLEQERLEREREIEDKRRIEAENSQLERMVAERTATLTRQAQELQHTLDELKTTQDQLIQSEKMASLGELTAGIAHEIQNPLNFVTNFSDVSAELVQELLEEQQRPDRDPDLEAELLNDLKQNLEKIHHHGQRAASIVRGMLEHSRQSTGERQATDLNNLADEYLRLAYHGLRAKNKAFNATINTFFDPAVGSIQAVGQDLGRVLLNLFTNAFYAVQKRQEAQGAGFVPTVSVVTRRTGAGDVEIRVKDNGTGIPEEVQQKIFQPFFTTKPTGEGTGLGLSLSYDIVTKGHSGTIEVESTEGQGTEFIVTLPG